MQRDCSYIPYTSFVATKSLCSCQYIAGAITQGSIRPIDDKYDRLCQFDDLQAFGEQHPF